MAVCRPNETTGLSDPPAMHRDIVPANDCSRFLSRRKTRFCPPFLSFDRLTRNRPPGRGACIGGPVPFLPGMVRDVTESRLRSLRRRRRIHFLARKRRTAGKKRQLQPKPAQALPRGQSPRLRASVYMGVLAVAGSEAVIPQPSALGRRPRSFRAGEMHS